LKNLFSLVVASDTICWRTIIAVAVDTLAHLEWFYLLDLFHGRDVAVTG
jgi:hypothetical protein